MTVVLVLVDQEQMERDMRYTSPSFSHVALISLSLCSSEVCLRVWKPRIMFVHVLWAQLILRGCLAVWWLPHWCLNLAFLCVRLYGEWECAFAQCLFALACVTFNRSPDARLQRLAGFQAGLYQVTVTSSLSHNCAAAASCWGSEDLAWHENWSPEAPSLLLCTLSALLH